MPTPLLKSLSKRANVHVSTAEYYWEEAKVEALKKFNKKDNKYWAYVTGIVKRRLNINESTDFKSFIKTNEFNYDKIFKDIKHNCSEFLNESNEFPLYRGIKKPLNSKIQTQTYRIPKDLTKVSTVMFNAYIEHTFNIKNIRNENSMFGTGDAKHAYGYGEVHFIFPVNGYEFIWAPDVRDLYDDWSIRSIVKDLEDDDTKQNIKQKAEIIKATNELDEFLSRKQNVDINQLENGVPQLFKMLFKPTIKSLDYFEYTNRNLDEAIVNKVEIMFQVPYYYVIHARTFVDSVLDIDKDRDSLKIQDLNIAYKKLLEKIDEI
jgi:hypothetical protein